MQHAIGALCSHIFTETPYNFYAKRNLYINYSHSWRNKSPDPKITELNYSIIFFVCFCLPLFVHLCLIFIFLPSPFFLLLFSLYFFPFVFFCLFHLPRESFSESDWNQNKKWGCNIFLCSLKRWFSFGTPVYQPVGYLFMVKMFFFLFCVIFLETPPFMFFTSVLHIFPRTSAASCKLSLVTSRCLSGRHILSSRWWRNLSRRGDKTVLQFCPTRLWPRCHLLSMLPHAYLGLLSARDGPIQDYIFIIIQ